ncbi:GNAT family N-acetyltransferase [Paraburkholderia acidisoli]|uniref:GNAT family N-acetyltransferase n=1 Tax=Paraburkholderia acidisoli TaxID=2571748 RepID=A0A7Z2GRR8_9BURK|nr:GNAT family N-acetyltransferase [Paraburkholderia acidisoli]QGZ66509.1 GNAT family N-acetyltransferase [Paraburkholderia acidisoli]
MNQSSMAIVVRREDPDSDDARLLLDELGALLALRHGDSGQAGFDPEDFRSTRGGFIIARTLHGEPVGCGGFRRFSYETVEIRRLYRRPEMSGVGSAVLESIEDAARETGYRRIVLRVWASDIRAIDFILRHGYSSIEKFGGKTANGEGALCFGKRLVETPEAPEGPQPKRKGRRGATDRKD